LWDGYWSPAHVFEVLGIRPTKYGLCHDLGSWCDRISGIHDGDGHLGRVPDLAAMWIEAGNRVQWRAVTPRSVSLPPLADFTLAPEYAVS
jgi:hypothetical protein